MKTKNNPDSIRELAILKEAALMARILQNYLIFCISL
jgi:hypothetical protein